MKTKLPGDFERLAQSTIDDEATDAQLEALESAIMDSSNGADILRDMAARQAAVGAKGKMPTMVKVAFYSSIAAAVAVAAVVTLFGAGALYFHFQKGRPTAEPSGSQVVSAPAEAAGMNLDDPSVALSPLAAETVPEPSTSLLLVSGLSLILLRRHR